MPIIYFAKIRVWKKQKKIKREPKITFFGRDENSTTLRREHDSGSIV